MIGLSTAILRLGRPPKVLLKKSRSLWLLFFGFGLVLGAPSLIDQATIRPLAVTSERVLRAGDRRSGSRWSCRPPGSSSGTRGSAGAAAPSTITRGAAPAMPVPIDGREHGREDRDGGRGQACAGVPKRERPGPWTSLNTPYRGGLRGSLQGRPVGLPTDGGEIRISELPERGARDLRHRGRRGGARGDDGRLVALRARAWSCSGTPTSTAIEPERNADLSKPPRAMSALDLPPARAGRRDRGGRARRGRAARRLPRPDRGAKPGPERCRRDLPGSSPARCSSRRPTARCAGCPVLIKDEWPLPWRAETVGAAAVPGVKLEPGESGPYRALRDAGAVIAGVAQHARARRRAAPATPRVYGAAHNPWDLERCPGGSSSGPAAAVAGGLVSGAVGADGLGSIRYPAAYCGLTGLKPTFGRSAMEGHHIANTETIVSGPLCRDAADCRLLASAAVRRRASGEPARRAADRRDPGPLLERSAPGRSRGMRVRPRGAAGRGRRRDRRGRAAGPGSDPAGSPAGRAGGGGRPPRPRASSTRSARSSA